MNKKIVKMPKGKHESGVALIYALALLGLLLVMLLGFLSSSILEQRIAYNQSSQVGANLLARSALLRIKAQMAEYADASVWMLNRQKGKYGTSGAPFIAPFVSLENKEQSLTDGNKKNKETDAYLTLKPLLKKLGMDENFFPNIALDYPEWIDYAVSDGKSDKRRISGRIAYAVLPNLGIDVALLRGSYGPTVGKDFNEFARGFDFLTNAGNAQVNDKNNWLSLDLLTGAKGVSASTNTYINISKGISNVRDEFFAPEKLTNQSVLNYYFTANQPPTVKDQYWVKEAFTAGGQPARYNLGNATEIVTGSQALVENLVDGPLKFGSDRDYNEAERLQRRQIAANIIDYIDADSKPTSDVDPSTWLTATPTYAGLEKTPYINQIVPAVSGNCVYTVSWKVSKDGLTATVTQKIKCTISGRIWVEAANPYDATLSGIITLNNIGMQLKITAEKNGAPMTAKTGSASPVSIALSQNGATTLSRATGNITAKSYNNLSNANYCISLSNTVVEFNETTTVSALPTVEANVPVVKLNLDIVSMGFERALLQPYISGAAQPYYADFVKGMSIGGTTLLDKLFSSSNDSAQAAAYADFEALDPRCNFEPGDWRRPSWDVHSDDHTVAEVRANGDLASVYTVLRNDRNLGSKNAASEIQNVTFNNSKDLEPDNDPVKVSTAYIRNAPMRSLWELGLIHRGTKYQTLNLKSALNPQDSDYDSQRYGYRNDAQLLDRFTLDDASVSKLKKYNINMPAQNVTAFGPLAGGHFKSKALVGALVYDPSARINYGSKNAFSAYKTSNYVLFSSELKSLQEWMANKWYDNKSKSYPRYIHRGMLANVIADWAEHGTSPYTADSNHSDAQVEELIGKIIPLTRCGDFYEDFTVFAVAETIKDVGSTNGNKTIYKYDRDGNEHSKKCKYGELDYDGNFMFDEITGRSYILARIRRELVKCLNTENCQDGVHEAGCEFKIRVLDSYILSESDLNQ